MNTPAHVVINLLALGRKDTAGVLVPVIIGSILPDLPIFWFYFVEKVLRGTPEREIWRVAYYTPGWQNFIDLFNSLPLILLGLGIAYWLRSPSGLLLFSSMIGHVLGDLPLHHDDGHRHLFPFSNWRFESPVSYWDPNHHGILATRLEILAVVISAVVLFMTYRSLAGKGAIAAIGLTYLGYFIYVLTVWR